MTDANNKRGSEEVISVKEMWAGYGGEVVLEKVHLVVERGDFIGLVGPNGGGKTTLLRVLLGLLPPMRGKVRVMGKPVQEGRRYIGYVPQTLELDYNFPLSVWEVTRMGRLGERPLLRSYTEKDDEIVEKALEQVEMMDVRTRPIGELSGGQRQRVYIARALATEPEILLLDEPTASVDPQIRNSIYELLARLNEEITILLVSHDVGTIGSYVKTVGCINRHLFYEHGEELSYEMLQEAYQCPIDLIAHGVPHRIFPQRYEES